MCCRLSHDHVTCSLVHYHQMDLLNTDLLKKICLPVNWQMPTLLISTVLAEVIAPSPANTPQEMLRGQSNTSQRLLHPDVLLVQKESRTPPETFSVESFCVRFKFLNFSFQNAKRETFGPSSDSLVQVEGKCQTDKDNRLKPCFRLDARSMLTLDLSE